MRAGLTEEQTAAALVNVGGRHPEAQETTAMMKPTLINDRWTVMLPEHRADLDKLSDGYWRVWERDRFASMARNIKPGMTVYEIGVEQGDLTSVVATFGGPENMVLIEPNPDLWPNIKATWEANGYARPRANLVALLGEQSRPAVAQDFDGTDRDGWPACAYGPIHTARSFRLLNMIEFTHVTPTVALDDFRASCGVKPDVLNIDVEGAELCILRGGRSLLALDRPLVYLSIHEEFMRDWFQQTADMIHEYMRDLGYVGHHIGYDHEDHWVFRDPTIYAVE